MRRGGQNCGHGNGLRGASTSKTAFKISVGEDAFILTTGADVVFTPASVDALLDLMVRDQST